MLVKQFENYFNSIYEANELLSNQQLTHTLFEHCHVPVGVTALHFENISVVYLQTSCARLTEGVGKQDYLTFVFFPEMENCTTINAQKTRKNIFMSIKNNQKFKLFTCGVHTEFSLLINKKLFIQKFENYLHGHYFDENFIFYNIMNIETVKNMIAFANKIASHQHTLTQKEIEDFFIESILETILISPHDEIIKKEMIIATKLYNEIVEQYQSDINISSLCANLKISHKTAGDAFKKHYALTPNKFLQKLRMWKIHEELSNNTNVKIKNIASRYGYNHMGNFSKKFKDFFGYLPSAVKNY